MDPPLPTDGSASESVLKRGRRRSVILRRWREGGRERGTVTKRFADPNPLFLPRDFYRAWCEHRALQRLAAKGVRVPPPVGMRRAGRAFEVSMEWLPDTRSLQELLERPWEELVGLERVARELGTLLAQVQDAGLDHSDLHPANVLVDGEDHPWLIDFHQARMRSSLSTFACARQLVACAARGREGCTPRFRARFFLAWWRALPEERRQELGDRAHLLAETEDQARWERRDYVEGERRRWTGPSGSIVERTVGGERWLGPRDADPELVQPILEAARSDTSSRVTFHRLAEPVWRRPEVVALVGSRDDLLDARATLGLLRQHRVSDLRPWLLCGGRRQVALFLAAAGTRPLDQATFCADSESRRALLSGAGRLLGGLHDAGWTLVDGDWSQAVVDAGGNASFGPRVRLVRFDPRPGAQERLRFAAFDELRELAGGHEDEERRALLDAYVEANRHSAEERRVLRLQLGEHLS